MKISSKGRYGIRAMVDLAINSNGNPIKLSEIAKRQNISNNYLEHHFSNLKKHGLVGSVKGPNGGYSLLDTPDRITLKEILNALEGSLSVLDDKLNMFSEDISIDSIMKEFVWAKLDSKINSILENITLLDIVKEYQDRANPDNIMFYI